MTEARYRSPHTQLYPYAYPLYIQIDGIEVVRVERRGSTAVHYTTQPLPVDKEVIVEVDWARRFDHMQHHSGKWEGLQ